IRCELPQRLSDKTVAERDQAGASLSAWEMWLVCKAKDDRLKMEQKAEEERILMERKQKEENEQLEKNTIVEEKIQQWLKMKKEQKQEKHLKESQEEEQIQRQQHKKREAKMIAEKKYKEWLIKKTQEKIEREKRETEEKAKKEAQEGERRQRAEDKFRQWLASTQDKAKPSPRSQCCPRDGYSNISYPLPSYYNPIPWKPVNIPPPEKTTKKNTSGNKQQCQKNYQQSPSVPFRLRNTVSAGNLLQKR
ncbi:coiled-coil domain-containing protein 34, partial [Aplochiton taeniatus]